MKILVFIRNDLIYGTVYNAGEIAGFDDRVADNLISKGYAKLHGDGKKREVGAKIPGAEDFWTDPKLAEHVAGLKREGKWAPTPPVVVMDSEVQRAARERARNEMNQI
jgi:hypothetical protein